jgi:hypothetical protein
LGWKKWDGGDDRLFEDDPIVARITNGLDRPGLGDFRPVLPHSVNMERQCIRRFSKRFLDHFSR